MKDLRQIEIKKSLVDFLSLQSPFESQQFMHQHPELISDEVDLLVDQLIASAISQKNEEMRYFFEGRRTLLRRCREIGIDQAFEEVLHVASQVVDDEKYFDALSPEALTSVIAWWSTILTDPSFPESAKLLRWRVLNIVARGLRQRYLALDDLHDLNRAIELFEEGAEVTPHNSLEHAGFLTNLGVSLLSLHSRTRELTDITKATRYLRESLDYYRSTAQEEPNYTSTLATFLNNLAGALNHCYSHTGNLAELDEAITLNQQAIDLVVDFPHQQASQLTRRGTLYRQRYYHTGTLTDLDESTSAFREALGRNQDAYEQNPSTAGNPAGFLCNLGTALKERYGHTKNQNELNLAIRYYQDALDLARKERSFQAPYLTNLGNGLYSRYWLTGDQEDLDEAIKYYHQAVEQSPSNTLELAYCLDNVGNGLRARFQRTGLLADLDEAIRFHREALKLLLKIPTERPRHVNNLASALITRYEQSNDFAFLEEAFRSYEEACEQGFNTNPKAVLAGSQMWGTWAMKNSAWKEAAKAFEYGLQAVDQIFRAQLLRTHKESWMQDVPKLHVCAAYTSLQNGGLVSAIEIIEAGRARLLSDAIERKRTDLENLPALGFEKLYENYHSVSKRLNRLEALELSDSGSPNLDLSTEIRAARAELDAVIESIQQIPKYEAFFRSLPFDVVQRTLTEYTTSDGTKESIGVYLLVTFVGGAAVIVHSGGVESVWLDFNEADLIDLLLERDDENRVVGGYVYEQSISSLPGRSLDKLLDLIGSKILPPVAQALHKLLHTRTNGENPRVVLIPAGLLSLLPLHAADYQINGKARSLLDDFTVTYTPSARALRHSQRTLSSLSNHPPNLVGISDPLPLPDGLDPLTFAQIELEKIATLFGGRADLLCQTQATLSAVEAVLDTATYLHFSCHGQFNAEEPLASGLILSNGERLTLANVLTRPRLNTTRLVTLSACQTAITNWNLPDEAVGLPSGFLQAGAPAVIGSLWPVNDFSTALLMIKFYEFHIEGDPTTGKKPLDPASALRHAQLWLRDVTNQELGDLFYSNERATPAANTPASAAYARAKLKFRQNGIENRDDRPFGHPYYWAAFAFYGV